MSDSSYIRILRTRLPYAQFDTRPWSPPLNIFETDREIILVIELAGVDPTTVQIEAYPERVRIAGVRQLTLPPGLRRLHRMEIAAGMFQIEIPFEHAVDPEQSSARSFHGLLEIRLPFARHTLRQVVIPVLEGE